MLIVLFTAKFITVGWGKKETQFHGSQGKEAAVKKQEVKINYELSKHFLLLNLQDSLVLQLFKLTIIHRAASVPQNVSVYIGNTTVFEYDSVRLPRPLAN